MRSPDAETTPRLLVTPGFHLLEAWYDEGEETVGADFTALAASESEPRAFFRLMLDDCPREEQLRRFPFVPPSAALLLFVGREADTPRAWHRQSGLYLDIRARDRRAIFHGCDQQGTTAVRDTEALWSAFWLHKEFANHRGELSDIKIDWLAERVIDRSRPEVERADHRQGRSRHGN